ncbi:MAG: hypothetical protein U5K28_06215 [Halobacteriales archaeon]|nr:hypothetical protein [Halobacteriales archaeon]
MNTNEVPSMTRYLHTIVSALFESVARGVGNWMDFDAVPTLAA